MAIEICESDRSMGMESFTVLRFSKLHRDNAAYLLGELRARKFSPASEFKGTCAPDGLFAYDVTLKVSHR